MQEIFSLKKALPIEADDTSGTLFDKLSTLGRDLLLETLPKFIDGTITRTPQNEAKVVFHQIFLKNKSKLNYQ